MSLNQWIASAVAEKVGTVQTAALVPEAARRRCAALEDLLPLLCAKRRTCPAEPDDRLE